jgi:hypothetical protein
MPRMQASGHRSNSASVSGRLRRLCTSFRVLHRLRDHTTSHGIRTYSFGSYLRSKAAGWTNFPYEC